MFNRKKALLSDFIASGALSALEPALAPAQFPSIARIPGDLQSILTAADDAAAKPPLSILDRGNMALNKMRNNLNEQACVLRERIAKDSEDLRQVNLMLNALDKGLDTISNDVALVPADHAS